MNKIDMDLLEYVIGIHSNIVHVCIMANMGFTCEYDLYILSGMILTIKFGLHCRLILTKNVFFIIMQINK